MNRLILSLAAICLSLTACGKPEPEALGYQIVATHLHDSTSYTQGLQMLDGRLFESSGMYGESAVREIELSTGQVLRKRPLAKSVFGEGTALIGSEMWVLTWKEGTVYVLEKDTFKPLRTHSYKGEGWGLATDGKQLIMSDGTDTLRFIDPKDFSVTRTLQVMEGTRPVNQLNELEWVDGQIFANIYTTHRIARISPTDGQITGWLDLSGLENQLNPIGKSEVLNGIAHDPKSGNFLITGKYWPQMFEIKVSKK